MAIPEAELKTAIFNLLKNDPDIAAVVGTKIFDTRVPPGPSPPWIRYYIVTDVPQNAFKSESPIGYRIPITVDCVASGEVATSAEDLAAKAFAVLDGASGTTSSFSWKMGRTAVRKMYEDETGIWTISGDYLVWVMPV